MDCLINTKTDVFARNKIRFCIPFSQLSRIDARLDLQPFFMIVIYIIAITFLGPFSRGYFWVIKKTGFGFSSRLFRRRKSVVECKRGHFSSTMEKDCRSDSKSNRFKDVVRPKSGLASFEFPKDGLTP